MFRLHVVQEPTVSVTSVVGTPLVQYSLSPSPTRQCCKKVSTEWMKTNTHTTMQHWIGVGGQGVNNDFCHWLRIDCWQTTGFLVLANLQLSKLVGYEPESECSVQKRSSRQIKGTQHFRKLTWWSPRQTIIKRLRTEEQSNENYQVVV